MANLEVIIRGAQAFVTAQIKKLTLDVHANLIATTPVDTGWARANWVPAIGQRFEGPVGTPSAIDEGAAAAGIASVISYEIEQGTLFISNGVPYIGRLNDGSSQQAPAAFVQSAIVKAVEVDMRGAA